MSNWVSTQPGISSTIVGATKVSQLEDNLRSIEFDIPADLRQRLDEASAIEAVHPYKFFNPEMQGMLTGGTVVRPWTPARVYEPASREPANVTARSATK